MLNKNAAQGSHTTYSVEHYVYGRRGEVEGRLGEGREGKRRGG